MIKKLVLILLCITLLAVSYTNVKAEEGIAGISVVLDNASADEVKTAYNNATNVIYNWTTERVNLREHPDINSDIIKTLDKRTKVKVISYTNKWVKVYWNDTFGYIYGKYLRDTELPSLDFTDEEIDLIAKILWLESRGEEDRGIAACTIVIFNRILHIGFGDTMLEVLSDKNEFSTWKLLDTAKPDERIYEIIEEVQRGDFDGLLTEDYVYFSTSPRNDKGTIKIGNHYFCKYEEN